MRKPGFYNLVYFNYCIQMLLCIAVTKNVEKSGLDSFNTSPSYNYQSACDHHLSNKQEAF